MGLSPGRGTWTIRQPTRRPYRISRRLIERPEPASLRAPLCANHQTVTLLIRQAAHHAVGFQQAIRKGRPT